MAYNVSQSQGYPLTPYYWADFMRTNLYPHLYIRQFSTPVTIPKYTGKVVRIPKMTPAVKYGTSGSFGLNGAVTSITSNLSQSTAPTLRANLSASLLTGTVASFEGAEGFTKEQVLTTKVDTVKQAIAKLGREMAFRIDAFDRAALTGANVKCAGGASKCAGTNVLRAKDLVRAATLLDMAGAARWDDGNFVGVAHPAVAYDVMTDITGTGFVPVSVYGQPENIYKGEIGTLFGTRLLMQGSMPRLFGGSTSATSFLSGGVTGTHTLFFSQDSFYTIALEGGGLQVTYTPFGQSGVADPTAKLGAVGVLYYHGVAVTPAAEWRRMTIAAANSIHA